MLTREVISAWPLPGAILNESRLLSNRFRPIPPVRT